jgi:hypothetical protein
MVNRIENRSMGEKFQWEKLGEKCVKSVICTANHCIIFLETLQEIYKSLDRRRFVPVEAGNPGDIWPVTNYSMAVTTTNAVPTDI